MISFDGENNDVDGLKILRVMKRKRNKAISTLLLTFTLILINACTKKRGNKKKQILARIKNGSLDKHLVRSNAFKSAVAICVFFSWVSLINSNTRNNQSAHLDDFYCSGINYFGTFAFSFGVHHQIWREFTICVKVGNNCALDIIPKLMHLSKKYSYVNLQTNKNQNGGVVTVLKLMHLR